MVKWWIGGNKSPRLCQFVSLGMVIMDGNAMNVKRTVKGYIRAGFAGSFLKIKFMFGVSKSLWSYKRQEGSCNELKLLLMLVKRVVLTLLLQHEQILVKQCL